jgi:hypothetical protein
MARFRPLAALEIPGTGFALEVFHELDRILRNKEE